LLFTRKGNPEKRFEGNEVFFLWPRRIIADEGMEIKDKGQRCREEKRVV